MKRVAITGLGAITPLGNSVKELWQNIVAGKSSAAPITKFDTLKFKTRFACEVKILMLHNTLKRNQEVRFIYAICNCSNGPGNSRCAA